MAETRKSGPAIPATPIAIVGMGAIFPGRGDTTGFWRDIFEGRDLLSDTPPTHWLLEDYYDANPLTPDRTYGRRGGFLSPVAFDPMAFGIPPAALQTTDTAQLLALIAAKMTLDDAERDSNGRIDRSRTSVVLGVASATELTAHMAGRLQRPAWVNAMRQAGLPEDQVQDIARRIESHYAEWKESTFPGLLGNVVAGRIANRLDLGGSNYVTDAACASSLSALQIAMHELRAGDSDMVLTGGVDALNDILMFMCFSKTPALSPTGDCRPFSNASDGTMLGEGIGMLALRRLEDAERDGNTIHAVICGLGGASDGKGTAIYTPLPAGQARALRHTYEQAGYGPETVDLVEAHGTGTKAGDKAEIEGLHLVFGEKAVAGGPWCAVGSVKSQIGHTKAAAGSASLLKAVEALRRKVLPPTIKIEEPADAIRDSNCFYVNTEARPWITPGNRPRRASVSSFGFGGSNFHVTLEEYTGPNAAKPARVFPAELFLYNANSPAELADSLAAAATAPLTEDAFAAASESTLKRFSADAPVRAAIAATSPEDFAAKAQRLAAQISDGSAGRAPLPQGCNLSLAPSAPSKIAFLFSGQGSQYTGMGADLAMALPAARAAWDLAASHPVTGALKLHRLAFPPSAFDQVEFGNQTRRLTAMEHAQPAIATVALSHLALIQSIGLEADMTGGHSFGEIMALHYGGAFDAETALTIAAARGRAMADAAASNEGAMLAVQCEASAIRSLVDQVGGDLVIANDNGPSQVVLSGPVAAIQKAETLISERGIKARRLPVATAFHSSVVSPAVYPFREVLSGLKIKKPRLTVYANATAAPYKAKAADLSGEIASQVATPVRFREEVEAMYAAGARIFVEIGPGNVVSGLVADTLGDRDYLAVPLDNKRVNGVTQFLSALGALSVAGLSLDFDALLADAPAPTPKPAPSRHAVMLTGANHDRPYPPKEGAAGRTPPNPIGSKSAAAPQQSPTASQPVAAAYPERISPPMPDLPRTPDPASQYPAEHTEYAAPASAVERIWQEVSQRHQDYLQTTAAAHTAYLNAAASILGSARIVAAPVATPALPPPRPVAAPAPSQAPIVANAPASRPAAAPAPAAAKPYTNGHAAPAPAPIVNVAPMPAPQSATKAVSHADPIAIVRAIISEKTGYPEDMLEPDMDLEGELGVDSIKQVEILSTLRDRMPELPEIEPEKLVELRTISAIAAMISGSSPAPQKPVTTSAPMPQAAPVAAPAQVNGSGVSADVVRALIAEKTGYPTDMLEDDMDLEGELGVDSIKQVEILSALRDRFPSLPEVDPEDIAELRSIRKIADFFA
ncbi:acyltransferase domain-containing protein [Hyphomonas sp. WL0036]|uniref:type I polyketide synthase n=1 Tax=Hyphomonas sediminis TaxID=2866160 RepID=UPI001C7F17BF|nr:type I polyketide synthase [Hyphomonas sediminis]MBY9067638.1 acyltransferase domain-containing protein [Hyphomonas sediminis]